MSTGIDPTEAYILVVEDNLQNMLLLNRLFNHMGVRGVQWKASGWEMFDVIETMPQVDLILLDLHLPHEDGYELIAKIRNDARLVNTKVVAVTADAHPEAMTKAQKAGFDGFLGKPIKPKDFPQQIKNILQGNAIWDLGEN